MTDGIYILANDVVYDQLVALLNSIEVNAGRKFPVCVIPYDDRVDKVRQEIQHRENVSLFEDKDVIERWDNFVLQLWQDHPTAKEIWSNIGSSGIHRKGVHNRFYGFNGSFERFIYLDSDILVLNSLEKFFEQLSQNDWIVYDFQHKDPSHVYNLDSPKLLKVFPQSRLETEIFCSGLYATKRGIFDEDNKSWLLSKLREGDSEILYPMAPDQTILNYMVMKSELSVYNFAHQLPVSERTGCCVTSPHFEKRNEVLYDKGKQLTYLHYIGLSSKVFTQLCAGENIDFPYREIFLHYRYLHEPEKRPKFTGKPKSYKLPNNLATRVLKKFGLTR